MQLYSLLEMRANADKNNTKFWRKVCCKITMKSKIKTFVSFCFTRQFSNDDKTNINAFHIYSQY